MNNNDILRRLRYALDYRDVKMIELFGLADYAVKQEELIGWLKKEDEPEYIELYDKQLATFLSGLIIEKRGKREGEQPKPEKSLNNNIIFRKLKIALNLKDDEILDLFKLAKFSISKHELSAIFRKPGQNQYRVCKDQFLRNFLIGLQLKYRK
ncbi:MAG: DUF1456 family protein [Bacteroidales bacterium]|nr:DUF1456 family protein [Bacteroidales bacterium]